MSPTSILFSSEGLTVPIQQNGTLTHALHCANCGYKHIKQNEIIDTLPNLVNEVLHDVEIEPKLQLLQGESFVNKSTTTEDEAQ